MKEQRVLQLIEIVEGKMLPISYWASVQDLADHLNVSGQAVRNSAAGLCKCKGFIIKWIDVDKAMMSLQDFMHYVDIYCKNEKQIVGQEIINEIKKNINFEL